MCAVYTRRASERNGNDGLGILDPAAIEKVKAEAWPTATNADELHDALMLIGVMTPEEIQRSVSENAEQFFTALMAENRALRLVVQTQHQTDREVLECGDPATAGPLSKRGHVRALQN